MNSFASVSPLLYVGIALAGILLTALVLFFLLREQKSIEAQDGTRFSSEKACRDYETLVEKLNALYVVDADKPANSLKLGLRPDFLQLLKEEGFSELKILLKYQEDFRKLVFLFDDESKTRGLSKNT